MSEQKPGMGAILHEGGVAFRVWAPHAEQVWVTGDFNGWSSDADPMERFGDHWYADVAAAHPGQEYKFVIRNGEQTLHRIDPYARQVTNSVGNGVIYDHAGFDWQGDDFRCPPHNELVIYETHVGSFVAEGDSVGSLDEVTAKIGHFLHLGVNCVQLMPVMEFAGDYSWGYNPAHLFAVETGYGGPDALKTFVRECHRNGIAVILDVVYNHFGPSDLDLWQFDGWNGPHGDSGGIYFYNDHRAATPWGATRPDYGRQEVRDFIRDNALMWLRDYHVDGLRYDMTLYMRSINGSGDMEIPEGWMLKRDINNAIRHEFPDAITIAEDLRGNFGITSMLDDGAGCHAQWDAHFVHPVREALETPDDAHRSMAEVADAVLFTYGDAFSRVIYTESHDEVANGRARVPQEVNPGDPTGWHAQKRSTMGAALALTAPGIPMLFQGQEFLQGEYFRDDVPLEWHQNADFQGIVCLYRDLIRLRRNGTGATRGLMGQHVAIVHGDEEANLLAYHRWMDGGPGDDTLVVVNLSAAPREGYRIQVPRPGTWALQLNSDSPTYSTDFGGHAAYDLVVGEDGGADLSIGPYTVLVYSYSG